MFLLHLHTNTQLCICFLIPFTATHSVWACSSARCERLEDQLNDLTELHQHETSNLKQELASIEEKVAYQAYERARDIQVRTPFRTAMSQGQAALMSHNILQAKVHGWCFFFLASKCIFILCGISAAALTVI